MRKAKAGQSIETVNQALQQSLKKLLNRPVWRWSGTQRCYGDYYRRGQHSPHWFSEYCQQELRYRQQPWYRRIKTWLWQFPQPIIRRRVLRFHAALLASPWQLTFNKIKHKFKLKLNQSNKLPPSRVKLIISLNQQSVKQGKSHILLLLVPRSIKTLWKKVINMRNPQQKPTSSPDPLSVAYQPKNPQLLRQARHHQLTNGFLDVISKESQLLAESPSDSSADEKIKAVMTQFNDLSGYDLALMLSDGELEPNIIEVNPVETGLDYRVVGPNNEIKTNTILWDKLPSDFPRDTKAILASKGKLLPHVLEIVSKAGHTPSSKPQTAQLTDSLQIAFRHEQAYFKRRLGVGSKKPAAQPIAQQPEQLASEALTPEVATSWHLQGGVLGRRFNKAYHFFSDPQKYRNKFIAYLRLCRFFHLDWQQFNRHEVVQAYQRWQQNHKILFFKIPWQTDIPLNDEGKKIHQTMSQLTNDFAAIKNLPLRYLNYYCSSLTQQELHTAYEAAEYLAGDFTKTQPLGWPKKRVKKLIQRYKTLWLTPCVRVFNLLILRGNYYDKLVYSQEELLKHMDRGLADREGRLQKLREKWQQFSQILPDQPESPANDDTKQIELARRLQIFENVLKRAKQKRDHVRQIPSEVWCLLQGEKLPVKHEFFYNDLSIFDLDNFDKKFTQWKEYKSIGLIRTYGFILGFLEWEFAFHAPVASMQRLAKVPAVSIAELNKQWKAKLKETHQAVHPDRVWGRIKAEHRAWCAAKGFPKGMPFAEVIEADADALKAAYEIDSLDAVLLPNWQSYLSRRQNNHGCYYYFLTQAPDGELLGKIKAGIAIAIQLHTAHGNIIWHHRDERKQYQRQCVQQMPLAEEGYDLYLSSCADDGTGEVEKRDVEKIKEDGKTFFVQHIKKVGEPCWVIHYRDPRGFYQQSDIEDAAQRQLLNKLLVLNNKKKFLNYSCSASSLKPEQYQALSRIANDYTTAYGICQRLSQRYVGAGKNGLVTAAADVMTLNSVAEFYQSGTHNREGLYGYWDEAKRQMVMTLNGVNLRSDEAELYLPSEAPSMLYKFLPGKAALADGGRLVEISIMGLAQLIRHVKWSEVGSINACFQYWQLTLKEPLMARPTHFLAHGTQPPLQDIHCESEKDSQNQVFWQGYRSGKQARQTWYSTLMQGIDNRVSNLKYFLRYFTIRQYPLESYQQKISCCEILARNRQHKADEYERKIKDETGKQSWLIQYKHQVYRNIIENQRELAKVSLLLAKNYQALIKILQTEEQTNPSDEEKLSIELSITSMEKQLEKLQDKYLECKIEEEAYKRLEKEEKEIRREVEQKIQAEMAQKRMVNKRKNKSEKMFDTASKQATSTTILTQANSPTLFAENQKALTTKRTATEESKAVLEAHHSTSNHTAEVTKQPKVQPSKKQSEESSCYQSCII
jgi:hypothetical protein